MAETPENKYQTDAIVTLGLQLEDDGSPKPELLQRVDRAVQLYQDHLDIGAEAPFLVMSGRYSASVPKEPPRTEAAVMREYALGLGVPNNRILEEPESMDTFGNALFTKRIAEKQGWKRLVVVSTAYHLRIGEAAFRHILGPDYEIIPVPSADPPATPAQINYERSATQTVDTIVCSTSPGDDWAILDKLSEIMPAYRSLFSGPKLFEPLHQATVLERMRRDAFPQAA